MILAKSKGIQERTRTVTDPHPFTESSTMIPRGLYDTYGCRTRSTSWPMAFDFSRRLLVKDVLPLEENEMRLTLFVISHPSVEMLSAISCLIRVVLQL